MKSIDQLINEYSDEIEEKMIAWRRDIHEHPELGNKEMRTSKLVADHLRDIGVDEIHERIGGTPSIIGVIYGAQEGPVIALRCDMDALPIKEETGLPFASKVTQEWGDQGVVPVMHACGHDCHTAMLMAAAEVIVKLRDQLKGKVALIFQAAEEGCCSDWTGLSGAENIVKSEEFQNLHIAASYGQHIYSLRKGFQPGSLACLPGNSGGSYCMYIIKVNVHGKGGMGARPWTTVDPIVASAQIVMGLQAMVSRNIDVYNNNCTISVGSIKAGNKFNVIPDEAVIDCAIRFTDRSQADYLKQRFEETVMHIAASAGATAEIKYTWIPAHWNDEKLLEKMKPRLQEVLGEDFVHTPRIPDGVLDDYSYFQEQAPGLFVRLDVTSEDPDAPEYELHTPNVIVNEKALKNGVKAYVAFALKYAD